MGYGISVSSAWNDGGKDRHSNDGCDVERTLHLDSSLHYRYASFSSFLFSLAIMHMSWCLYTNEWRY